jgi:hypothetical protein
MTSEIAQYIRELEAELCDMRRTGEYVLNMRSSIYKMQRLYGCTAIGVSDGGIPTPEIPQILLGAEVRRTCLFGQAGIAQRKGTANISVPYGIGYILI